MDVKLVLFLPDGRRKDLPIRNQSTLVGRGEKCDLRIPLLSVSRRHCEMVVAKDNSLLVKDLGSSNGTFVNNKRIAESPLKPGDRLAIGPIIFTVQIDGVPEEIQPVATRGARLAGSSLQGQKADTSVGTIAGKKKEEEEVVDGAALEQMVAEALRDEEEGQI
jgi:pSer/pThr/pTyr-binding forkhead associated (FHA) protein